MAEAGLAWVPSMIQGLDIWYQRTRDGRRLTGEGPINLPKLLPSEYFHRQIWISFVDDPVGVKMVGGILDEDKVMFGSDYPHPASTWPDSQGHRRAMAGSRGPGKNRSGQCSRIVWNLGPCL
jgi:predicted TIM-barrel fold metal-dependent hydrolase